MFYQPVAENFQAKLCSIYEKILQLSELISPRDETDCSMYNLYTTHVPTFIK